jgi:hypothetical protein
MREKTTRHFLERVYGFAVPATAPDGRVTYECSYCDARDDGAALHAAAQ